MIFEFLTKDRLSHVGMVIQSTTLDTMEKVINQYGGTEWTKIEGQFLLGASSNYAVNSTGGSATNTLSVANLPSHNHGLNDHTHSFAHTHGTDSKGSHTHNVSWSLSTGDSTTVRLGGSLGGKSNAILQSDGAHTHTTNSQSTTTTGKASGNTTSTGSGTAVNNMPPYKTVYIWERTA